MRTIVGNEDGTTTLVNEDGKVHIFEKGDKSFFYHLPLKDDNAIKALKEKEAMEGFIWK